MKFISTYSNLRNHSIFVHLLLTEIYEQGALRKEPIIASFLERFKKATLRKVFLMKFISTYSNLLNHFIFVHLLLTEIYEQGALRKEPVIASFVERFKKATLRKFYW